MGIEIKILMTIAVTMINFAVLTMSQQSVLITFWIFTVTRARHKLIIMVMHMVEGRYTKNKWVFVSEFPTITINDSNVSVKLSIVLICFQVDVVTLFQKF